jgi:membrane protein
MIVVMPVSTPAPDGVGDDRSEVGAFDVERPHAGHRHGMWPALRCRAGRSLVAQTVRTYFRAGGQNWAAAIALNLLLSLFPIFLLILFVASLLLHGHGEVSTERLVSDVLPPGAGRQQAVQALGAVRRSTGILGVLSLLGLAYAGSGLFGCMETAFSVVHRSRGRPWLRQKLMALSMIGVFAVLTLAAIGSSSALALVQEIAAARVGRPPVSLPGGGLLLQAPIGVAIGLVLFGSIYLIVPNLPMSVRRTWPGTVVGAVAFELLGLAWPYYIRTVGHNASTYGALFGLFALVTSYVLLLAQIVVIGACVNATVDERRERRGSPPG